MPERICAERSLRFFFLFNPKKFLSDRFGRSKCINFYSTLLQYFRSLPRVGRPTDRSSRSCSPLSRNKKKKETKKREKREAGKKNEGREEKKTLRGRVRCIAARRRIHRSARDRSAFERISRNPRDKLPRAVAAIDLFLIYIIDARSRARDSLLSIERYRH